MFSLKDSLMLALVISVSKGHHDGVCSVEPKDLHIEEGSSVAITCQSSCADGKIFWTLDNKTMNESLTINLTHTALLLKNFTYPSATLQCHSSYTNQVLGGTIIKTYSKPKNVSCIIHHTNPTSMGVGDLLTCRWVHPMKPSPDISYTVLLSSSETSALTEICSSHVTNCTAKNMGTKEFFFGENYTVTVRAKTAAWEVYAEPFEFNYDHIFKINPPWVTVKALSDHLVVKRSFPVSVKCQVKYHKSSSSVDETPKLSFIEEIKITEVESCVIYKLSVRCALEKAPWSEWSQEKAVLSKLNEHHIQLFLWRKVSKEGNNGKRKVHLMWMGIPSACEVHYTVEKTNYRENTTEGNTSCGSSACDVEVDQHAHRLYLRVSSDERVLVKDSVYVPAVKESLPRVTDIQTSTHDGIIRVSWKAPVQPVSGYIIDWTHDGSQYHWEKITSTNATLSGLQARKLYNITITPLLDDRTGHGEQAHQTCSSTGVPETVFINDVIAYDTSAHVIWDTKSHNACSSVITVMAFYKSQDEPLLNVTVDGEQRRVFLKDLKPSTQYTISVEAQGHDGNITSTERFFTTVAFDPRLFEVLIVCGIVSIFLLLFLGICCSVLWRKFKEKPVPNPGLSSVAKWLSQSHQKKVWFFQPFGNHTENFCDPVCAEETQRDPSLSPICSKVSDLTAEYCDPSTMLSSSTHDDWSSEPTETQLLSSPEGSISFVSTERCPVNPYRSQSSVETLMSRTENQWKSESSKQQDKATPKSVYVSLNMFEQGNVK